MSRYIDADAFESILLEEYDKAVDVEQHTLKMIFEMLSAQPTADVVEVIRCEHCLHWDDEKDGIYVGNLYHCCDYDGEYKDPCDFCSYAERREDDEIH